MDEQIYIIIAKVLDGEASPAERQALDAWLRENPDHAAEYEAMKGVWHQAGDLFTTPGFNTGAAWEKVAAETVYAPSFRQDEALLEAPQIKGRRMAFPAWTKYAVAAAAVLLICIAVFRPGNREELVSATDGNRTVTLPDGSVVTLRKGSTLAYPGRFAANERHVALTGEAFFEVTRNERHPFVIDAQAVAVKVLGTSFNVQCTEQAAEVTVATGKVQVTAAADPVKAVVLTPCESGRYEGGQLTEEPAGNAYLYWKNGELKFDNQPLETVVSGIADAQQISIRFSPEMTQQARRQGITINFRNQSAEDMLTELCLVTKCKWQKQGNGYLISGR